MAPEDDVTPGGYMIWRGNPAAILPPPALPEGRRSFGCTAMARPADLHRACGGLRHSVETAVAASAKIAKGSRREGRIPAGYTYLGQLLAHDLCAPAEGAFDYPLQGAAPAPAPSQRQSRAVPLHLETLFGPIALKRPLPGLHRFAPHPAFPMFAADINRVAPCDGSNARADLHDGRNDDSPMVAQISALFVEAAHRAEAAFRQQGLVADAARLAARAKVARLWHRILVQDYLPRLCLPGLPPPVADRTGQGFTGELHENALGSHRCLSVVLRASRDSIQPYLPTKKAAQCAAFLLRDCTLVSPWCRRRQRPRPRSPALPSRCPRRARSGRSR